MREGTRSQYRSYIELAGEIQVSTDRFIYRKGSMAINRSGGNDRGFYRFPQRCYELGR